MSVTHPPLREAGIACLLKRLGFLSERLFGDNLLIITSKLCSHNFSEKTSARGTITDSEQGFLMAWQNVSRKGGGKGWNNGGTGPALAINNSNAKFNLSACPIHLHQASPGEQGTGKGQTPKGQGKGVKSSPAERKSPNLKPEEERAEPTTEEVKCPKYPNTYNWTTRVVCRSCGCKLP